MDRSRYILAYDVGTSGVKGVLVTMMGEILRSETEDYPLYTPYPGWAEQDPQDYWRGVCSVTKRLLEKSGISPSSVAGIVSDTMWRGIIPVDKKGNVLYNNILWLDSRAGDQAKRLNEHFGAGKFTPAYFWPKLMWLRENRPDIIEKADVILEVNSFLKWKMTSRASVDISNCFVRSLDPELESFYEQVLSFMDVPQEKFPELDHCHDEVGRVTEKAAAELGLVPGIPVFGGCNDIIAITIGSGSACQDGVHIYFGSSGWIGYTCRHKPVLTGSAFDETRNVMVYGIRSVGLTLRWIAEKLYTSESEELGGKVFGFIDREAEQIPAGSEGVLAAPWFYGGSSLICGPDARGCFLNLGPGHDRRHMARAMMEAICYQLRMWVDHVDSTGEYPCPEAFNVIGGGAVSDFWMQMLADVLKKPVTVPNMCRQAGAVGAACCALVGLGEYADFEEAARNLPAARRFWPRPEVSAVYDKSYEVYKQLYTVLKPLFQQMNTVNTEGSDK